MNIPLDIGSPRVIARYSNPLDIHSDALDGTVVDGQMLSLDYEFSNLVWLLQSTRPGWHIRISAQTNLQSSFGLIPSVSDIGYMVRLDGSHGPTQVTAGNRLIYGDTSDVLFGLVYSDLGVFGNEGHKVNYYYTGMHFDLTLPDLDNAVITGLTVTMESNGPPWAITDHVPDAGSTLALMTIAMVLIAGYEKLKQYFPQKRKERRE